MAARAAYLLVLALATLASLRWDLDADAVARRLVRMVRPVVSARDAVDAARNVALFGGWGVVWTLTAPRDRTRTLVMATLTGAALSMAVELAQLFSATRRASVLDLGTNTVGAFLGAALVLGAVRLVEARTGRRLSWGVPALLVAGAYSLAVGGEALVPLFRQQPVPGAWGGPARRFAAVISRFRPDSWLELPLWDVVLFLPAGFLVVMALLEEGVPRRRAAMGTALVGLLLSGLLELAHGALGLSIIVGAALLHGLSVAAGALAAVLLLPAARRGRTGGDEPRMLIVAYTSILLVWSLRPLGIQVDPSAVAADFRSGWWVPLAALGERVDVFSVVDVANGFLLYIPIGALLAAWPLRRHGPLAGPVPAVCLAVVAELSQVFVPDRTLDVTDILTQAAGAVVGWLIARRGGVRVRRSLFEPAGVPGPGRGGAP